MIAYAEEPPSFRQGNSIILGTPPGMQTSGRAINLHSFFIHLNPAQFLFVWSRRSLLHGSRRRAASGSLDLQQADYRAANKGYCWFHRGRSLPCPCKLMIIGLVVQRELSSRRSACFIYQLPVGLACPAFRVWISCPDRYVSPMTSLLCPSGFQYSSPCLPRGAIGSLPVLPVGGAPGCKTSLECHTALPGKPVPNRTNRKQTPAMKGTSLNLHLPKTNPQRRSCDCSNSQRRTCDCIDSR